MIPIIWAAIGALTVHLVKRGKTAPSMLVKTKPQMTPAKAAVHGDLMRRCIDPRKLRQAAAAFGAEGLSQPAAMLLAKAKMIHDMMHGAQSIVERCRTGDQHAMALAKGIGEQARAGNKRAQISAFLIEDYSKKTSEDLMTGKAA